MFVKLFVADVDRDLIEAVFPGEGWFVDYRFFFYLSVVVVLLVFARLTKRVVAYVVFFPLIVLVWKIPRAIYRTRSWIVLLAALNAVAVLVQNFKFVVVTSSLAILATFGIGVSDSLAILVPCSLYILVLFLVVLFRTLRTSFSFSRFLRMQETLLTGLTDSSIARNMRDVEKFRDEQIVKFNSQQLTEFTNAVSWGIGSSRLVYFWAYQLDRYRASGVPFLFNVASYVRLFLYSIFTFTLLNLAVLHGSESEFTFDSPPSVLLVAAYSLTSFVGSGVSGLDAVGDWALALKIATGVTGLVLIASALLNVLVTARRARQEAEFRETVRGLKRKGRDMEVRFRDDYDVTIDEALQRLQALGAATLATWLLALTSRIPRDFFDES